MCRTRTVGVPAAPPRPPSAACGVPRGAHAPIPPPLGYGGDRDERLPRHRPRGSRRAGAAADPRDARPAGRCSTRRARCTSGSSPTTRSTTSRSTDVRGDVLVAEGHTQASRAAGRAARAARRRRRTARARRGVRGVALEGVAGTVRFDWAALDAWYEEDEQVFVHPRNPYTRVDALRSTRRVRVELDGVVLAESPAPVMVFETGLPTRYYLSRTEVDFERLVAKRHRHGLPVQGRHERLLVGPHRRTRCSPTSPGPTTSRRASSSRSPGLSRSTTRRSTCSSTAARSSGRGRSSHELRVAWIPGPPAGGRPARLPPGQYVTHDFPVLSAGPTPHTPLDRVELHLRGARRRAAHVDLGRVHARCPPRP